MKKLTIGFSGNPNSGKTTLFNQLTGARRSREELGGHFVERKERASSRQLTTGHAGRFTRHLFSDDHLVTNLSTNGSPATTS